MWGVRGQRRLWGLDTTVGAQVLGTPGAQARVSGTSSSHPWVCQGGTKGPEKVRL